MYSSISELAYVDNIENLDNLVHCVFYQVLVEDSVSCFIERKTKNVLILQILAEEVIALTHAMSIIPLAHAVSMIPPDTDLKMISSSEDIIGIIKLNVVLGTYKAFRIVVRYEDWEWDTGGGQMQESPGPGVNIKVAKVKFDNIIGRYEWWMIMDMDEGGRMVWKVENEEVRTTMKNVQIYLTVSFSYSAWKLGHEESFSRGLLGRNTTNVRQKQKITKKFNNVLLGSLLVLILMLLLRVKECSPKHEVIILKEKCKNMKMMTIRMMMAGVVWMMSRKMMNKLVHMMMGNIRKRGHSLVVSCQNLPGGLSQSNKQLAIDTIIRLKRPDVLSICEPRHSDLLALDVPGYVLVKGIANSSWNPRMNVFIKDCLMVEIDQKFCCDIPTVKMKIGDQHLLFVYREWRVDGRDGTEGYPQQLVRWKTLVDTWRKLRGKLLVMGDFNLEFWRCVTQQHRDQAPMKDYLMDNIIMKGYVQLLKDITRSQRDSSSCIDHIYTNSCEHLYMDSLQNVNIVGYDHNSISIRLKLKGVVHEVQIIETQAVKTLDPGRFSELWSQIDFSSFWRTSSVDEAVEIYTEAVKACLDNLIPLRKIQIRPDNAPWLTKELLAEMKVRNEMRDEAMRTGDEDKWQDFKVFRNKLRIKCDKIKKNHLNEGLHGDDSKRNWRNIMAMSGLSTKKSSKIWLKENGESIDDPKEVAEHLNNFFVSIVNKIVSTHPPNPEEMKSYTEEYVKGKNIEKLNFRCVDTEAVLKIIHDIKPTGTSGTDSISMIMIKKLSMVLAPFLTRIVNSVSCPLHIPATLRR